MSIYFIAQTPMRAIKIGYSSSPRRRLYALRNASAHPLEIVAVIDGDRETERELHQRFAEFRMFGEWFEPRGALRKYLASLPPYQHERKGHSSVDKLHPDAAAIDRVGTRAIMEHFEITRQSVFYWRRAGVPRQYRKALALMGEAAGHPMTEMAEMRDRLTA